MRVLVAAVTLATMAISGLLIVPRPQQAVAALVATGVNDSLTMKHDRTSVVPAPGVLGNDLNLIGGSTAILVSGVAHGTLSLRSDGGYTYSPAAGYVGSDSFVYHPSGLLWTAATVSITITNATPVARPDAYSGTSGTTLVVAAPGVLANDTDADGDALIAERVGGITGSLDLDPNGGFRYTPGGGFSGTATFNYRVWDGVAWSGTTTVTLTISAPAPTPTPTLPLPTPTLPLPTPTLPLPTPTLPLPSIAPPGSPSPSPTDDPSGSRSPGPSSSQDPSAEASPAAVDSGPGGTPTGSGTDLGASSPGVRLDAPASDLGVGTLGVLAGFEIWAVPAAVIGGPGLLVLIWIALQAAGAMAWVPAARRLREEDVSRIRRRD